VDTNWPVARARWIRELPEARSVRCVLFWQRSEMGDSGDARIPSLLTIDTLDPARLVAFWAEALEYQPDGRSQRHWRDRQPS
jgi:hypothetical protein